MSKMVNYVKYILVFIIPLAIVLFSSMAAFFYHPQAALGADQAMVKEQVVNLRSAPGTGNSIVGKAARGDRLEVLAREGDWLKVNKGGLICWVANWLVDIEAAASPAVAAAQRAVVKDPAVNLRSGPGTGNGIVGKAARGDSLEVLAREGDWLKVNKGGLVCWVAGWLVEVGQAASSGTPAQSPPPSPVSAPSQIEVTADGVNIRGGPGTGYSVVGRADSGNRFNLLDKSGDWYKIAVGGGSGWVYGQFARLQAEAAPAAQTPASPGWAVISGNGVNIRNGPGTSYQVVTRANQGDKFLLADRSADWYKIVLNNGNPGWVYSPLVSVENGGAPEKDKAAENPSSPVDNTVSRGKGVILPPTSTPSQPNQPDQPSQPDQPGRPDQPSQPGRSGQTSQSGSANTSAAGLKSLSARVEGGNVILTIASEKVPLDYTINSLEKPDRLVIDLKGVEPGAAPGSIGLSSSLAGGVRVGWFSKDPCVTRVVLDLKTRVRYEKRTLSGGSQLELVISPRVKRSLSGARIVLDPGHGGKDPGAISATGVKEKDVNLDIARKAAEYLKKEGATVILTRSGDSFLELADRPKVADKNKADLFISIHSNSNPSSQVSGTSTYYVRDAAKGADQAKTEGMYLARYLQSALTSTLGRLDKGVLYANFAVLTRSNVPAALVETAFLSNPEEERMLKEEAFRDRAAQALVKGIKAYLGNN